MGGNFCAKKNLAKQHLAGYIGSPTSALGLSNSEAFDFMKLWNKPGGNYKYGGAQFGGIEVQFQLFEPFDISVFGTLDRYGSPTTM